MRTIACALLAGVALSAQEAFRTAVEMVRVVATVVDEQGRFVPGLTQDDFRVVDGGREQPLTLFSADREPVSVGFLMDISNSMRGSAYANARAAFATFLREHLGPGDEVLACVFSENASCLGWSSDRDGLIDALSRVAPGGGTTLYDALDEILRRFAGARHPKQALVILSDGNDFGSRRAGSEAREALHRSEVISYAIGFTPSWTPLRGTDAVGGNSPYGGPPAGPMPAPMRPVVTGPAVPDPARANLDALHALTDETGGRTLLAASSVELPRQLAHIAAELGNQYLLGYRAPRAADGKYHEITVSARDRRYEVRARRGYLARLVRPRS